MSKYANLSRRLESNDADSWTVEFSEIEAILEAPLPSSAYQYAAWWSNQGSGSHSQSRAWQDVGWRTANLDIANRRVTFVRDRPRSFESSTMTSTIRDGATAVAAAQDKSADKGLSIAEAKVQLAIYFGVLPENIDITIRG